jgi:hypothetical protein
VQELLSTGLGQARLDVSAVFCESLAWTRDHAWEPAIAVMSQQVNGVLAQWLPPDAETVSRALPIPDRDLVRTDEMFLRINAAANSRAPRR